MIEGVKRFPNGLIVKQYHFLRYGVLPDFRRIPAVCRRKTEGAIQDCGGREGGLIVGNPMANVLGCRISDGVLPTCQKNHEKSLDYKLMRVGTACAIVDCRGTGFFPTPYTTEETS